MIYKIIALIRAFFCKIRFEKIEMPCLIGKPLFWLNTKGVTLEKRVRIFPNSRIETHQNGSIIIHKNCSIGQGFHVISGGMLEIGSGTTISGNVFISNLTHSYEKIDTHALEQEYLIDDVSIGPYCFIGYGSCILPGSKLGKNVIVGANSVVKGIFPDYVVIAGNPARIIKEYDQKQKQWKKVKKDNDNL